MNKSEDIKIEEEKEDSGLPGQAGDKLKKLKEKLKNCQKERDEYLDGWQRARADFINYKKDEGKQREEFIKFSNNLLISDILLVLDSLGLACRNIANPTGTEKGFQLIHGQLNNILKKYGLTEIKTTGEKFNPRLHEAVEEVESDKESGIITETVQKGYLMHDKVIRAAKVKISK